MSNRFFQLLFCCLIFSSVQGQAIQKDGQGNILNLGDMKSMSTMYDIQIDALGRDATRMPYSQINDSPFWKDDWQLASIFSSSNSYLGTVKVKLNLATQQFYYQDKDQAAMVASTQVAKRVVVYNNSDTSSVAAVFDNEFDNPIPGSKAGDYYLQECNQGAVSLLKLTRKVVHSADSLFGTMKRYYFSADVKYFILNKDGLHPLKKLKKDEILGFCPDPKSSEEWIQKNNTDFRKEEEVVRFLEHLNHPETKSN